MKDTINTARYYEMRQKLEYYRKKNKLTQSDVVAQLGAKYNIDVDRSAVSHWESGTEPSFSVLSSLANIYGVSLDDFKPGYIYDESIEKAKDYNSTPKTATKASKQDFSSYWDDIVNEEINKAKQESMKHVVDYINERGAICEPGLFTIDKKRVRPLIENNENHIAFSIDMIPLIAAEVKKSGFTIVNNFPANSSLDPSFDVVLPNEKAARYFEGLLITIISQCAMDYQADALMPLEKCDETAQKALVIKRDYCKRINLLMDEICGEQTLQCTCYNSDEKIINGIGCASKNDLLNALEAIGEIAYIELEDNHDGYDMLYKNKDAFFNAYDGISMPLIKLTWLEKDKNANKNDDDKSFFFVESTNGETYRKQEEDFLNDEGELPKALKAKKRSHLLISTRNDNSPSKLLGALDGRIIPEDKIDELIDYIEQQNSEKKP